HLRAVEVRRSPRGNGVFLVLAHAGETVASQLAGLAEDPMIHRRSDRDARNRLARGLVADRADDGLAQAGQVVEGGTVGAVVAGVQAGHLFASCYHREGTVLDVRPVDLELHHTFAAEAG